MNSETRAAQLEMASGLGVGGMGPQGLHRSVPDGVLELKKVEPFPHPRPGAISNWQPLVSESLVDSKEVSLGKQITLKGGLHAQQ